MERVMLRESMRRHIRRLWDRQERESHGEFIAEGVRVCRELLYSRSYRALVVVIREGAGAEVRRLAQEFIYRGAVVYTATERQFASLCSTETPQDILAVVSYPVEEPTWEERMLLLDGVADPGNVGTLLRTALWFGWRGIILMPGGVDVYNPKVVRASAGAVFHLELHRAQEAEGMLQEIQKRGYVLLGTQADAGIPLERVRLPRRAVVAVGSEAHGLSEAVRQRCRIFFRIPGSGLIESLNVAIATAIVLYHFWQSHGASTFHAGTRSRAG